MQLPGRNALLRCYLLQLLDHLVEIGAVAGVFLHALTLQGGKGCQALVLTVCIAAVQ